MRACSWPALGRIGPRDRNRRDGTSRGVAVCLCLSAIREISRGCYQGAPFGVPPPSLLSRARSPEPPIHADVFAGSDDARLQERSAMKSTARTPTLSIIGAQLQEQSAAWHMIVRAGCDLATLGRDAPFSVTPALRLASPRRHLISQPMNIKQQTRRAAPIIDQEGREIAPEQLRPELRGFK